MTGTYQEFNFFVTFFLDTTRVESVSGSVVPLVDRRGQ